MGQPPGNFQPYPGFRLEPGVNQPDRFVSECGRIKGLLHCLMCRGEEHGSCSSVFGLFVSYMEKSEEVNEGDTIIALVAQFN